MIRFALSLLLAQGIAAWFYNRLDAGAMVFLHAGLGFLLVAAFDLIRIHAQKTASLYVYLLGTFVRIVLLGVYGVFHMFSAWGSSGSALMAFATVMFACLFFGVAWEAGASIHSHRR